MQTSVAVATMSSRCSSKSGRSASLLGQARGKSAEGLFAALQPSDAADQARWLLVLEPLFDDPAFRGPRPEPGTRTVRDLAPLIGILEQLMAEVPEIVEDETLTPARLKSTLHDADQFRRLLVAVQMFAREDPERVAPSLSLIPRLEPCSSPRDHQEARPSTKAPPRRGHVRGHGTRKGGFRNAELC